MTRKRKLLSPEELQAQFINVNRGGPDVGPPLPPPPPKPSQNGSTPSEPWLPRPTPSEPKGYEPGNSRPAVGRLAVFIQRRPIEWLIPDLVPRDTLTFLIGMPSCGKSSFGAWLASQAQRPAILPGSEESVEAALIPRLAANQVALERTLILDGRLWSMPHDKAGLVAALRDHRADLLWIDPIDSYAGEAQENDGQAVRAVLESFVALAAAVPCAVVAARHPGKQAGNLCPGSRQWRTVPRQILHMTVHEGPPLRRFIAVVKEPTGARPRPRECRVFGEPGEPGRFTLGPEVSDAELSGTDESDEVERWRIDDAGAFLLAILKDGELESGEVYKRGEAERFTDRTLRRAAKKVGVQIERSGNGREHKSVWKVVHSGTPDNETLTPPPPPSEVAGGGVSVTVRSAEVPEPTAKKARKSRGKKTP